MAVDKSSVSYMKDYLKYALEFEKYVYIWSQTMNDINDRMRQLYSERKRLETIRSSTQNSLSSLDTVNNRQRKYKEQEAERYKRKAKNSITVTIVILAVLFVIGCGIGASLLSNPNQEFTIPKALVMPILGLAVMVIGSLFTGVLPICIGVIISNKSKASRFAQEAKQMNSQASRRRQEIILQARESDVDNDWAVNVIEESAINKRQEEVHEALLTAKKNLAQVYSENALPAKYRNLTAVATLYEYLETGRCNTIQGHGGIYDTYEVEKIAMESLRQQIITNQTLSRMEDNQRYICQELRQANRTLSSISSSLNEIEKTNAEIAKNTAISAVANQQTAAATSWLAWNVWANGY